MKNRHAVTLLQKDMTTAQVRFVSDFAIGWKSGIVPEWAPNVSAHSAPQYPRAPGQRQEKEKTYTYKVPNDGSIKKGDLCVVCAPSGLAFVEVLEVHFAPQIDVDADFDYRWIVQRIDFAAYQQRVDTEQQFADALQQVELEHRRAELAQKMTEHLPPGSTARAMFDAALERLNPQPVLSAPAAPAQPATPTEEGMRCK